jgi:hypothetical protein
MPRFRPVALSFSILSILILSTFCLAASPDRIAGPIAAAQTTRLAGGVPMKARPEFDRGPVEASMKLSYVTLLTVPSASQQKALNKLLADQQNPHSPYYHQWLTPEKYADRFGLSQNDIGKITAWLQSQGLTVVRTARGRNHVVFSGTAAQVESAFQTQIHRFEVDGETHFANVTPPAIPTALSGVVVAVRGLSNFLPKSNALRSKHNYTLPVGGGKNAFFLAPGDIATMYDINPLYTAGIDGTGQKLAVIGETDVYLADLNDFRSGFGLSQISGCTTSGTDVITACNSTNFQYVLVTGDTDPGAPDSVGDDLPEADIDIEWSGATARNAQIVYVNAPDPNGSGVYDSLYFTIDNDLAPVMTMSYTAPCELAEALGGFFAADEVELQAANSEGITFLNSSGDTGAAECDYGNNLAIFGYAVAYPASSPSVTGVGGTLIPHTEYNATYWSTTTGTDGGSALSYIPEYQWNDAQEMGAFCTDPNLPPNGFCTNFGITSWSTAQNVLGILGGGGGVSNCFTIDVNGGCTGGFPQPSYQAGLSIPGQTTAVRFSPDVSLLASVYWPGFIVCTAGNELGGPDSTSSCDPGGATGILNNLNNFGYTFGGTSISSPIFAGIVTLMNQYVNGSASTGLGNINPALYALAAIPSNKVFNPVTTGNNGAYCTAGTPSDQPAALRCPSSGPNAGFLGYDASKFDATTNYNLATGLGSVDAFNLVTAFAGTDFAVASTGSSTLTVSSGQTTPATYEFSLSPMAPATSFSLPINFSCSFSPADPTLSNSSCTFDPSSIAAGQGTTNVTLQIATVGPNPSATGPAKSRADNRSPWLPLSLPLAGIVMAGIAGRKLSKSSAIVSLCFGLVLLGMLVACGGGSSAPPPPISVAVSQGTPSSLYPNNTGWPSQTATFTATVTNDSASRGVTWTASSGSIASTGATTATFTAPTIASGLPSTATITATSVADSTKSGAAIETLKPATVPRTYTVTIHATDGLNAHTQTVQLVVQ